MRSSGKFGFFGDVSAKFCKEVREVMLVGWGYVIPLSGAVWHQSVRTSVQAQHSSSLPPASHSIWLVTWRSNHIR